ncbi:hypothetical protein HHI36_003338 [Cryptolaemus montrouzieri]|uniref:Uncharacterized protein n=1 Tax=Cryptolaemus montrouzieri TaxID=559131 RepID=A0ABD2PDM7_9CUCU
MLLLNSHSQVKYPKNLGRDELFLLAQCLWDSQSEEAVWVEVNTSADEEIIEKAHNTDSEEYQETDLSADAHYVKTYQVAETESAYEMIGEDENDNCSQEKTKKGVAK